MHAAGYWGRIGSLTSLPVLPLSLVDEEHWRREWSTDHHRSLMDLGGTVDFRRVVDESCSPIPFPFACTTDYYILRHPRCLQRLLGFRFRIVIIGIWFTVRTSARNSSRSTFDPPQPISLFLFIAFLPHIPFSLPSSRSPLFLFPRPYQSIPRQFAYFSFEVSLIITFLYPYFLRFFDIHFSLPSFRSSLSLFPQTHHSLYLANLHIFSSTSAYHYYIPMPIVLPGLWIFFGLYLWLLRILSFFLSSTV